MDTALIFGKFYPLHKGHLAMIRFASEQCSSVIVAVCASDKELISGETRVQWLTEETQSLPNTEITLVNYSETVLENTSVASREVSEKWATKFKELFPQVTLVVTSEPYGEYVAEYMTIRHLPFDLNRCSIPISSSKIRKSVLDHWDFLPDTVKKYYQKKVVINGTESTGKTTLCKFLASELNASLVPEAGRHVIADSQDFTLQDLEKTAQLHAEAIEYAEKELKPIIILDTDIYTTQSYAKHFFDKNLGVDKSLYEINHADIYLYLANDVPFVQDGTRLAENDRNFLDKSHREILSMNNIDFCEIGGGWDERQTKVKKLVLSLLRTN